MNLKSACKIAFILAISSIVTILLGQILSTLSFYFLKSGNQSHLGWSAPQASQYNILISLLHRSIPTLLQRGLLVAGFITLLSAVSKQQNAPQTNIKTRFTVAATLLGITALLTLISSIFCYVMVIRRQTNFSFNSILYLYWHIINGLCIISLFIFALRQSAQSTSRTPAITAITCYSLKVLLTIINVINLLYTKLTSGHTHFFSPMYKAFCLASSIISYTPAPFSGLAAVLLFLYAWLKNPYRSA